MCLVVLGIVALARHEPRRLGIGALALGIGALGFQFLSWAVLVVAGAIVIGALLFNIGSVFESLSG